MQTKSIMFVYIVVPELSNCQNVRNNLGMDSSAKLLYSNCLWWETSMGLVTALCLCVCFIVCAWGMHIDITQLHMHAMQQTRMHKAGLVTRRLEAKILPSRPRQLDYRAYICDNSQNCLSLYILCDQCCKWYNNLVGNRNDKFLYIYIKQ